MTLFEMSSAVLNNLAHGLKGTANIAYSKEQIEYDLIQERSYILMQASDKNTLDSFDLAQSINCIPVNCSDLAKCCIDSDVKVPHFEIPILATLKGRDPIYYIGTAEYSTVIPHYYDSQSIKYHKHGFLTGNRPFIYIDKTVNGNNKYDAWLFNGKKIKFIKIKAILENPLDVYNYECCKSEEQLFPASAALKAQMIDSITRKYMNYYKTGNLNTIVIPNNQKPVV